MGDGNEEPGSNHSEYSLKAWTERVGLTHHDPEWQEEKSKLDEGKASSPTTGRLQVAYLTFP